MLERHETVVIGAGICGLLAARGLSSAGRKVLVLEKSRGFGGRMATKRLGDAVADHGAQFFTARDYQFGSLVSEWEDLGIVRVWPGTEGGAGEARFVGVPSMTAVAKHLAAGLEVRRETRVRALSGIDRGWRIELEGGGALEAGRVVATAPVPQVMEWLAAGGEALPETDRELLGHAVYEPCLTLVAALDGPSAVPAPGWLSFPATSHPVLAFVADNQAKAVSAVPSLTLQANGAWSHAHYGAATEAVSAALLEAAAPWLGAGVKETALQRWRYSRVIGAVPRPFWRNARGDLLIAGDGFGGARVEGAAVSALEAVRYLQSPAVA